MRRSWVDILPGLKVEIPTASMRALRIDRFGGFPLRRERRFSAVCMAARSGSAPYFFGLAAVIGHRSAVVFWGRQGVVK
ncbi:MAG: hypothetical protein M1548_02360 [Actinobacteria bacterium]|nr:hypothetical protein [Actinomycetota bacterium]